MPIDGKKSITISTETWVKLTTLKAQLVQRDHKKWPMDRVINEAIAALKDHMRGPGYDLD